MGHGAAPPARPQTIGTRMVSVRSAVVSVPELLLTYPNSSTTWPSIKGPISFPVRSIGTLYTKSTSTTFQRSVLVVALFPSAGSLVHLRVQAVRAALGDGGNVNNRRRGRPLLRGDTFQRMG